MCVTEAGESSGDTSVVADADSLAPGTSESTNPVSATEGQTTGETTSGSTSSSGGSSEDSTSGGPSTLADGLIVYWPLDDDFELISAAIDMSGNELHAECDACPASVPGRVGSAAGFSTDAVLSIPDHPLLRPESALSLSIWALDTDPQAMQTQFVAGKVATGVYNSFQISTSIGRLGRDDEMVWRIIDDAPVSHEIYLPNPLEPDVWHHLAGVWDGATSRFYLDGMLVQQVAAPAIWYDAGPFVVGADDNDGFVYYWRGAIDEVRLYDRALTDSEVGELAAQR